MEVMEQRRSEIVAFVNERESVTFAQLKERFPSVSEMTLRTDLKVLDQNRQLVRIHGGAKSIDQVVGNDDVLKKRFVRNTEAKRVIAKKALAFVEANRTIFFDSGSTTTMLAHILKDQPDMFFTSGLTCAIEMARLEQSHISLVGGSVNCRSLSVNGSEAIQSLQKGNFDIAFIGVTRFDQETGFTCESLEDALLKRTVIARTKKIIVLMDSSKIGQRGTYTICQLQDAHAVICDNELPQAFKEKCEELGVAVY